MSTYSQTLTIRITKKIGMNEMRMNDDEMSMRWSNRARSIPKSGDISPKEAQVSTDYGGNEK